MQIEGKTVAPTRRLYAAVIKGDLPSFLNLIREDPLVVDRCVIENSSGGFNRSLLHVAVHMGHLEMVKTLLNICPGMCLAHDQDGRNPIHVAAIQGRVNVLEVLHEANPHATQERMSDGQTVLHLCVKHNQLNALKILLELVNGDGGQLLNSKDTNGNTVLHLAVAAKQPEVVEYLLKNKNMEKDSINLNKMTALDIHVKQESEELGNEKIKQLLKHYNAKPAKNTLKFHSTWYEEQRTCIMVVASLIATMAFQVGINPPGGVWQEDNKPTEGDLPSTISYGYQAGYAIWSYFDHHSVQYSGFNAILVCNTVALISSLSVILILISGFECKRHFLGVLRVTLWIAVTATTLTYSFAVVFLAHNLARTFSILLIGCIIGWILLITGSIASGNASKLITYLFPWIEVTIRRFCKNRLSRSHRNATTPMDDDNNGEITLTI